MAKSNYCSRYVHKQCVQFGHADDCDCDCHKGREDDPSVQATIRLAEAQDAGIPEDPMEDLISAKKADGHSLPHDGEPLSRAIIDQSEYPRDEALREWAATLKPGFSKPKPEPRAPEGSLDAIAQKFLEVLYGIDPTWEERDRACAAEWALGPAQRLLKYAGIVLDQQLHLNMLQGYEFLEPGVTATPDKPAQLVTPMTAECPQCHKPFDRKVPGQVTCSNECGETYFPKPARKQPEFEDAFNKFLESQINQDKPPVDPIRNVGIPVSGVLR